jgi:hypothetical protein
LIVVISGFEGLFVEGNLFAKGLGAARREESAAQKMTNRKTIMNANPGDEPALAFSADQKAEGAR